MFAPGDSLYTCDSQFNDSLAASLQNMEDVPYWRNKAVQNIGFSEHTSQCTLFWYITLLEDMMDFILSLPEYFAATAVEMVQFWWNRCQNESELKYNKNTTENKHPLK